MLADFTQHVIDQHIAAGRLSPGARGMRPEQSLPSQFNEANGFGPSDPQFLVAPAAAQSAARLALRLADHLIPPGRTVVLTDAIPGDDPGARAYAVSPSQVEFALDHLEQVTGDLISADAVVAALPWGHDAEYWNDGAA